MSNGLLNLLPETPSALTGWPWFEETDPAIYNKEKSWPKISIVTPSFNQGNFIEETIRSIILQNYPNLEYIIIDGGSTDNTVEIIKKYESWITVWKSEPDKGQSDAINKGIFHSSGEIFNWINSDDYLAPNALYEIGRLFKKDTLAVCGFCRMFDHKSAKETANYQMALRETTEKTLVFRHMNQPATFLNLAKVKEVGGVNQKLNYVMDFELWVKLLLLEGQDNIVRTDSVLSNFRLHGTSKSVTDFQSFRSEEYAIYISIAEQIIPNSVIISHLKTLTNHTLENKHWEISSDFSPGNFEVELKRRFYPGLFSDYYKKEDYRNCKKIFLDQARVFKPKVDFGFIIEYFKFVVLPVKILTLILKINRKLHHLVK